MLIIPEITDAMITTYMDITQKIIDPKGASREIRYRRINDRSAHQLKYDTIRNCIFAVDIEPSAVDIAQLRLWLALVIDDEIDPNAISALDGHRNPLPLPNLECNILCGNSLIDEFEGIKLINESDIIGTAGDVMQVNLYQSGFDATLQRLIEKQEELFKCEDTEKKKQLLQDIDALREDVIMSQLHGAVTREQLERYYELKTLASKPFVLWQLDFARVFREKGGFDIVIGNPPYIQLQKSLSEDSSVKLGDLYKNLRFETFDKSSDIYCLFYEEGIKLLRRFGTLAFITSNKWMRAGYGKSLRRFFVENSNPLFLINFGGQKVFESASVDVNILILTKSKNMKKTKVYIASDECRNSLSSCVMRNATLYSFDSDNTWTILSDVDSSIKKKIVKKGIPIGEWNIQINYGIKTGYNDAFIIDGTKKDELIYLDPKSADLIVPIIRGRDIKRYQYRFADLWLINVHNGLKEKGIPPIDINDYPAIKQHLDQYYAKLIKRADKGDTPYNLRNCAYLEDFYKRKIVYPETTQGAYFALDEGRIFLDKTCFFITTEHPEYLLATLSSTLFEYAYKKIFSSIELGQNGYQYNKHAFILLPIIPISNVPQSTLMLIDQLIGDITLAGSDDERDNLSRQVDNVIYQLYDITQEEIEYINNNSKKE